MRICAFIILALLIAANLLIRSRIPPFPKPVLLMDFVRPLQEIPFALLVLVRRRLPGHSRITANMSAVHVPVLLRPLLAIHVPHPGGSLQGHESEPSWISYTDPQRCQVSYRKLRRA